MKEHEKPWEPLLPEDIAVLFAPAPFPWWIAGGYTIEHFVGRPFRSHGDIDILVLQRDSAHVRSFLRQWDCWAADPPGHLRRWSETESLPKTVNDVWCRGERQGPWRFQLMFDHSNGESWRSRRNPLVTRPISAMAAGGDPPFLAVEVQLFYKAKTPRQKDEFDFGACLPLLSALQRDWLRQSIVTAYGTLHPWLTALDMLQRRASYLDAQRLL